MESLVQDLDAALDGIKAENDCGCGGRKKATEAFALGSGDDLSAELDAALDVIEGDDGLDAALSDDPFADLVIAPGFGLDDLVGVAERHPGLKICISF
jgi:hypothetical protein